MTSSPKANRNTKELLAPPPDKLLKAALGYNTSPPGNMTPAYRVAKKADLFKVVHTELPSGNEVISGRFRLVDDEGMEHITAPDWLIKDFLPEGGYALLVGARGTFKTFVALDIALTIATGGDFPWKGVWGDGTICDARMPGPVLFAAGEGRSQIRKRVRAWEKQHYRGDRVSNFFLADPVPHVTEVLARPDGTSPLDDFIMGALDASPKGYRLLVIDTIGRAMQGVNENAQEHASNFTKMVEVLQRSLGCAVLALHHTGYSKSSRARGSSVFEADADTVVRLDRTDKNYVVSLVMTKQKDAEEWEAPRIIKLRETHLDLKLTSLVAVRPKTYEEPARAVKATREEIAHIAAVIRDATLAILKEDRLKEWGTRALAEAVAMYNGVNLSSSQIRQKYLTLLREGDDTPLNSHYDPAKCKWRYHGE